MALCQSTAVNVKMCVCVAMAMTAQLDTGQLKFGSLWCWWAAESSHLPPTSVTMHFHSFPSPQFFAALPLSVSSPPPALPDPLSICPSLTSSSSFSPLSVPHPFLCPSFLIGCISPRGSLCHAALEWVRVCLSNHMCVFVCELVHCSQAVGRAWVMTPEQLFRPSGPFLYSQPNSWLPPSHYCTYPSLPPQLYSLAYLLPISSLFPLSALFFFYVTRV